VADTCDFQPDGREARSSDGIGDGVLLVTLEEAARRLSIGRTSVYALVAAGELGSVRVGRSRRIRVSDLRAYVGGLTRAEPTMSALVGQACYSRELSFQQDSARQ
jgi:excisionase family DNA binding protein